MIRVFGHYLSRAVLGLALFETFVLLAALYGAQTLRLSLSGLTESSLDDPTAEYTIFVITIQTVMLILGLYQRDTWRSLRQTIVTLTAAFALSTLMMALLFFLYPPVALWRSIFVSGMVVAFSAIQLVRVIFLGVLDLDMFKSRLLVLGAGRLAERIAEVQQGARSRGFSDISFVRMGQESGTVSPVHARGGRFTRCATSRWRSRSTRSSPPWRNGVATCRSGICSTAGWRASASPTTRRSWSARPARSISTASCRAG